MAIGLDNDCIEGRIYWGDISTKKIISSKYDGSDIKTFIGDGNKLNQEKDKQFAKKKLLTLTF